MMGKIYSKLLVVVLAVVLSISVIAVSSYAWIVLSSNPAVEGIEIAIGGGNTILVAADMTEEVDGVVYHYPGHFSDKLNFSRHPSYAYLSGVGGLTPVSTADGINWFLPTYYDSTDDEVRNGLIPNGQIKDITDFKLDSFLEHANLPASDKEKIAEGSYIYLDFWVVSPGEDYTLRVSTGEDSGGSFLIDLMEPVATQDGYTLVNVANTTSASARVGFLVSADTLTSENMQRYEASPYHDERYTSLRGSYFNPGDGYSYTGTSRFTIYEPNGDSHPGSPQDGSYLFTRPIALAGDRIVEVGVFDILTVQKKSTWSGETGMASQIEQRFQTALRGMTDLDSLTAEEISDEFYNDYLQGQLSPYVTKGDFIKRSSELAGFNSLVSEDNLATLESGGATEDVAIIQLEKNIPQRIRMFVWLEGQDVDCVDSDLLARFALNIELAGSNAAEE